MIKPTIKIIDRDRGMQALIAEIKGIAAARVEVGVFDESQHDPESNLTTVEVAAVNEFGTDDGRVPARSFIRSTFDEQRFTAERMLVRFMGLVVYRKMTVAAAFDELGKFMADSIKAKIQLGPPVPPPNTPATIRQKLAKGYDATRTLVASGKLAASVVWRVLTT